MAKQANRVTTQELGEKLDKLIDLMIESQLNRQPSAEPEPDVQTVRTEEPRSVIRNSTLRTYQDEDLARVGLDEKITAMVVTKAKAWRTKQNLPQNSVIIYHLRNSHGKNSCRFQRLASKIPPNAVGIVGTV